MLMAFLVKNLLSGWASRIYFSDNGSTAVEIALKMAFRKFLLDHGIRFDQLEANAAEKHIDLKVTGFIYFEFWIF